MYPFRMVQMERKQQILIGSFLWDNTQIWVDLLPFVRCHQAHNVSVSHTKPKLLLEEMGGSSHQNIADHCRRWHPEEFALLENALKTGKDVVKVVDAIKSKIAIDAAQTGPLDKWVNP